MNFFKDILDKDKDKFYYDELKFIVGVDEYYKGEILFEHVGIESLKDNVLVIKLKQMDELFLKNLTKDKFSLRKILNICIIIKISMSTYLIQVRIRYPLLRMIIMGI